MPACISGGDVRLRMLKFSDGPFVRDMLRDEEIVRSCGLKTREAASWFFVWWWIKKTFTPAYCIECNSRAIGFIGIYDLAPGRSAEVSLVISDKVMRRRGYGRRAFELLSKCMRRHSLVREVFVKVGSDNRGALSFWRKLGFSETKVVVGPVITLRKIFIHSLAKGGKRRDNGIKRAV
jgi:RimJ/RimL family protein N-acetyltransferase